MNPPLDSAFDIQNALTLLDAAAQAYAPPPGAVVLTSRRTDTQAIVQVTPSDCLIAFRGTTDLRNWLTDIDCRRLPLPLGGASSASLPTPAPSHPSHPSYSSLPHSPPPPPSQSTCASSIASSPLSPPPKSTPVSTPPGSPSAKTSSPTWATSPPSPPCPSDPARLPTPPSPPPPPRRLWLTGHSLGGALAILAAADPQLRAIAPIAGCYTFGQPRVGNAAFAAWHDSILGPRVFRIVHADDLVPRVPWLLGAYRHSGNEIYFPTPSALPLVNPRWLRKLPSELLALARACARPHPPLLADHSLRAYMNTLSRCPASLTHPAPLTVHSQP